jgi:GTP cyclohydrolase I
MDKSKVTTLVRELLIALGENPGREGLTKTPERIACMYEEILSGMGKNPSEILQVTHELEHDEMVIIKDVPFYSMCEHDLLPFFGKCHIAYIPENNRVVGISRLTRIIDLFSKRLQVQERLTTEVANSIMKYVKPKGVAVVIEARHLCMEMRGTKQPETNICSSRAIQKRYQDT